MHSNVEHYQSLASVYSLFYDDFDESMKLEGAWLATLLRSLGARNVLDACCGTGRQAIPLAEAGFAVVAADPCREMLAEGEKLAERHDVSVAWIVSDFEGLPSRITDQFDAVIAMGNGLSHCGTRESVARALASLRRCCTPGAACVIGIKDFDHLQDAGTQSHDFGCRDENGITSHLTQTWEVDGSQLICRTTLRQTDSVSGRVQSVQQAETREYMLGSAELRDMAVEAGFRSVTPLAHPGEAVSLLRS